MVTQKFAFEPAKAKGGTVDQVPKDVWDSDRWAVEPKLDGSRYVLYVLNGGIVKLLSRRESVKGGFVEKQGNVPQIAAVFEKPEYAGLVLDGEIMHPDGFSVTQPIMGSGWRNAVELQGQSGPVHYHVFDILSCPDVGDMRALPMSERRRLLESTLRQRAIKKCPFVELVPQALHGKSSHYRRAIDHGEEGVMLKSLEAPYGQGWLKCKSVADVSVIITGFTEGKGKYKGLIGAVVFGVYDGSELVEVGQASGMTDEMRVKISRQKGRFKGRVIDVTAQEISPHGRLRHPRFVQFRMDVSRMHCTLAKLKQDMEGRRR